MEYDREGQSKPSNAEQIACGLKSARARIDLMKKKKKRLWSFLKLQRKKKLRPRPNWTIGDFMFIPAAQMTSHIWKPMSPGVNLELAVSGSQVRGHRVLQN